ncbi:hypothetical protein BDQ17DRAFT_1255032 [Cyathus striatus]|nr:hypothetical protein BDQ17DRAFT_1255032 [Cyathus striatus]
MPTILFTVQTSGGPTISLSEVTLVSMFVESVLYGLFVSVFVCSTYILIKKFRRNSQRTNKPLLIVSILMFILSTMHIAADVHRVIEGFIKNGSSGDGVLELYFSEVNTAVYLVKTVAYVLQTLVGDAFVLYRLYLIWGRNMAVVLPMFVCFLASIGVAIGGIQSFVRATSPENLVLINTLQQWVISFISLTFSTNFISTLLISSRIWWSHRRTMGMEVKGRSLGPAIMIIIESGVTYSACLVIMLTVYIVGHFTVYIVQDAITHVIGIVFSLIIVRVALGISSETVATQRTLNPLSSPREMENGATGHAPTASDTAVYSLRNKKEVDTPPYLTKQATNSTACSNSQDAL